MSRFTEDLWAVPIEEDWTPHTYGELLSELGVFAESKGRQRQAVAQWLQDNEPLPFVRVGLERAGLIVAQQ